jgi:hypothetical protein
MVKRLKSQICKIIRSQDMWNQNNYFCIGANVLRLTLFFLGIFSTSCTDKKKNATIILGRYPIKEIKLSSNSIRIRPDSNVKLEDLIALDYVAPFTPNFKTGKAIKEGLVVTRIEETQNYVKYEDWRDSLRIEHWFDKTGDEYPMLLIFFKNQALGGIVIDQISSLINEDLYKSHGGRDLVIVIENFQGNRAIDITIKNGKVDHIRWYREF